MATLQQQIAEKFLAKLAHAEGYDKKKISAIRALLASGKKLKADDLVRVFSAPADGDLP